MDIEVIKAKIAEFKAKGCEVPDMDMIKTPEQIEGIRAAAKINNACLDLIAQKIKAGMTTEEIDALAYDFITKSGGIPACLGFYGFPKSICTSVNDQVCHGIPDKTVLKSGDIVNVDVTTIYNGYYADASRMFMIGKVSKPNQDLVAITKVYRRYRRCHCPVCTQARLQRGNGIWRARRWRGFSRRTFCVPRQQKKYRHADGAGHGIYG